jgi:hypothetical protein
MPLSLNDRNPDLIARVDDAYERALTDQGELTSEIGGVALEALIDEDMANARAQGMPTGKALEAILNAETRGVFTDAFNETNQLFNRLNVEIPTPDDLVASGINFEHYSEIYEDMERDNLDPVLILAPSLLVHQWTEFYAQLTNEDAINPDVRGHLANGGLSISSDAYSYWDKFAKVDSTLPQVTLDGGRSSNSLSCPPWTLRLIPGESLPQVTDVPYGGIEPTVHEYLTLQARALQAGKPPVDIDSSTWLQGTAKYMGQMVAPCASFNQGSGEICVRLDDVRSQDYFTGTRYPQWVPTNGHSQL